MSQPPWTPPPGGDPDDERSYRGAHSSGDTDESGTPTSDTAGSGDDGPGAEPGTPGTWSGAADQSWAEPDPWAGAKASWTSEGAASSGPGYAPPAAPPPPSPEPGPSSGPSLGSAGYGPPSYGHPGGPAAGPAVGEPAYAPGGYDTEGQPQQAWTPQPFPSQPPAAQAFPPPAFPEQALPPQALPPQQPPPPPGQTGGDQDTGGPFRSVRHDAVPPGQPAGPPPGLPAGPPAAGGYTPAEAPPTPRPPQPELPHSMSDVPQYAARLAPAPLPDSVPHAEPGPGGWAPQQPPAGQQPGVLPPQPAYQGGEPGQAYGEAPGRPTPQPWTGGAPQVQPPAVAAPPSPAPMPRPEDLLVASRPRTLETPATWGWRGRLSRMTGGLYKPRPSDAELADRQARINAQRGFSRPMTVVVIQPKGGAGKTPTTICVSSALGVRRGGYIVGWDNNETRGTLAVRTTNDDDQRTTAWDLLGRLDEFEGSEARVGDLSYYMRAQGEAQFDALVSDDNPGNMAQIGEVEFKRIHQVLQRFYRMIIIDTGNNVRSTNWQAAVDHADQIVVVSTYQRDVGYSGSWVLDHLSQTGREELARDAITVLTAAEPSPDEQVRTELVKHFEARTRAVVEVPYDPHIAEGGPIRWDELTVASQRAWTSVAAAITQTLYDRDQRQLASTGRAGH